MRLLIILAIEIAIVSFFMAWLITNRRRKLAKVNQKVKPLGETFARLFVLLSTIVWCISFGIYYCYYR